MCVRPPPPGELDPEVVLDENLGLLAMIPDPLGESLQARRERSITEGFAVFDLERQEIVRGLILEGSPQDGGFTAGVLLSALWVGAAGTASRDSSAAVGADGSATHRSDRRGEEIDPPLAMPSPTVLARKSAGAGVGSKSSAMPPGGLLALPPACSVSRCVAIPCLVMVCPAIARESACTGVAVNSCPKSQEKEHQERIPIIWHRRLGRCDFAYCRVGGLLRMIR